MTAINLNSQNGIHRRAWLWICVCVWEDGGMGGCRSESVSQSVGQ